MTRMNQNSIEFPQDRHSLIERATSEPDGCISVGGLAYELGLLRNTTIAPPRVLGKLVELARRKLGWTLEHLAAESKLDLEEVVNVESVRDFVPQPQTVVRLAQTLGYSPDRLMELAGLTTIRNRPLAEAALRFASRSEPASPLTTEEKEAYEQFVAVLVDTTNTL